MAVQVDKAVGIHEAVILGLVVARQSDHCSRGGAATEAGKEWLTGESHLYQS